MRKRIFPVFSILLLFISLVAPGVQSVAAAEKEEKTYEDGEYKVPVRVLHADKDESSTMQNYVKDDKTSVTIEEGKAVVFITLTSANMIKDFEVSNGNTKVENDNEDEQERTYSFTVDHLDEITHGKIAVEVPGMYDATHDIRLQFDTDALPEVEDEKESEDGSESEDDGKTEDGNDSEDSPESGDVDESGDDSESTDEKDTEDGSESEDEKESGDDTESGDENASEDGSESEDENGSEDESESDDSSSEQKMYEDGKFSLDYTVDVAAMDRYMEKPAQLMIDEGNNEVTVRFNSQKYIANFEVEKDGKLVDATKQTVDDEYVDYVFTVDNLDAPLHSKVTVDTGRMIMPHEFNISFETSKLTEVKPDPNDLVDGTYDIDYKLLHETEDKASTAAGYVVTPAKLKVENGVKTVYFTITDHEAIKDFKLEQNGHLSSTKTVKVNEEKNTRLVAIEVEQLDAMLKAQFKVFVPAMNYEAEPYARVQFNPDSIKKSDGELPEVPTKPELEEKGTYTMNMRVLEEEGFTKSPVGNYIKMPIDLTVKDGANIVLLTLLNSDKVKDFKIERKAEAAQASLLTTDNLAKVTNSDYESVEVVQENKDENSRIISFAIDDLDGQVNALVSIEEDGVVTDHPVRLFFEENSIRESDGLPIEDPETPTEPEEPSEELDATNLAEGVYTLDYTFLEKGTADPSTMDGFTTGPAYVKVDEEGNQAIAMTFTNASMIKYFKINEKMAKALQEEEDERIVEFSVADLTAKQAGAVYVEVPGLYETEHEVDLVFDTDTLATVDSTDYPEDLIGEEEPENPEEGETPNEPEIPDEDLDPKNLVEGFYQLNYTFLEKGTDNPSSMDKFTSGPAHIKVDKNGVQTVAMTLTGSDMIKEFKVNGKVVKVLQEDEEESTRIVEFPVKDLTEKQAGAVSVEASGGYSAEYEVDLIFDTDSLASANDKDYPEDLIGEQEPEEPENPGEGETPTKPEKPSEDLDAKNLAAGVYTLDYTFLEKGKDTPSAMDNFTSGPAYVKVDNKGNQSVAMTLTGAKMIKQFEVNGKAVKVLQEDKEKETRVVEFSIKDLTKKQAGAVSVEVPGLYDTEHEVDLVFDTDTLATASEKDYPKDLIGGKKEPADPEDPKKEKITTNPEEPVNPELDPENLDAGEYQIDYTFLEKGKNTVSIMDGFTSGLANVKVDDKGNQFVAITFTSASYIKGFEVNGKSAKVLQADAKKDEMIVEFPVENLTKKQAAWVSVDVPGVYKTEHEVDLVFHTNTLDVLETYPTDENPEQTLKSSGNPEQDTTDDQVPGFDRNADGTSGDGKASGLNPKTADLNMTQIILLALLLTGSLIPLMIKLRRKMTAAK